MHALIDALGISRLEDVKWIKQFRRNKIRAP